MEKTINPSFTTALHPIIAKTTRRSDADPVFFNAHASAPTRTRYNNAPLVQDGAAGRAYFSAATARLAPQDRNRKPARATGNSEIPKAVARRKTFSPSSPE